MTLATVLYVDFTDSAWTEELQSPMYETCLGLVVERAISSQIHLVSDFDKGFQEK